MATTNDYMLSLDTYSTSETALDAYLTSEWSTDDDDSEEGDSASYHPNYDQHQTPATANLLKRMLEAQDVQGIDIWSLRASSHDPRLACYGEISRAISIAANEHDDPAALDALTFIWNQLDDLTTETEAKFRLRLEPQKLRVSMSSHEWLTRELDELKKSGADRHLLAIAEWMIVNVLNALDNPSDVTATICKMPSGCIDVDWDGRAELRWVIAPIMLPFPGVKVRTFVSKTDLLGLHAETFRLAPKVVEHAKQVLSETQKTS